MRDRLAGVLLKSGSTPSTTLDHSTPKNECISSIPVGGCEKQIRYISESEWYYLVSTVRAFRFVLTHLYPFMFFSLCLECAFSMGRLLPTYPPSLSSLLCVMVVSLTIMASVTPYELPA